MPEKANDFKVDFFCIGAPKCASTWLAQCLDEHPEINVSTVKEPNFFVRTMDVYRGKENGQFLSDWDWYRSLFDTDKICGDFSVYLLMGGRETAEVIHSYFPDAKFLVTLRDPVFRVYSHYWHDRLLSEYDIEERESFPSTFEEAIANSKLLFVGKYYEQLCGWLEVFPLERFHIVLDFDLAKNRRSTLGSIFSFLGVDSTFVPDSLDVRVNRAARHHPLYLRMLDTAKTLKNKGWGGFFDFTRVIGVNDWIQRAGTRAASNPPIDPGTAGKLRRYYLEDIKGLESLLGRDLGKWKTGVKGRDRALLA